MNKFPKKYFIIFKIPYDQIMLRVVSFTEFHHYLALNIEAIICGPSIFTLQISGRSSMK